MSSGWEKTGEGRGALTLASREARLGLGEATRAVSSGSSRAVGSFSAASWLSRVQRSSHCNHRTIQFRV